MSIDILSLFQRGELLVIHPVDGDDCDAIRLAGELCTFQNYVPHTGHGCVFLQNGKRMYFQPKNLRRPDPEKAMTL